MSSWQSIETAPKDESILLSSPSSGVVEAFWKKSWYRDENNPGWMPANLDEEYGWYIDDATHWMALPAPPVE